MLFPTTLQNAAQAAVQHKESLITEVLLKLGIIKLDTPYDMLAISRRCRFTVHGDDTLGYPKDTQIFEVDGVPRLAIYPHTQRLERRGENYVLILDQPHQFL